MKSFLIKLTLLFSFLGFSQSNVISGRVIDENNFPLAGVNIVVSGTQSGTTTDESGNFLIEVSLNQVLQFKYLGYQTQDVLITDFSELIINMTPSSSVLDEVILTGYGSQSNRFRTDNIAKISSESIIETQNPNLFNSLSGKVSGVRFNQSNGKLESGLNVSVRGQSSISASSDPLYIIDGVPLMNTDLSSTFNTLNPLITLSPNEIESITVLKDASSASIYGSRAANGVVLITTKKGEEGKTRFSIDFSHGFSKPSNLRRWLNSDEYVELLLESAQNSPFGDLTDFVETTFDNISNNTWRDRTYDTNWQDLALINGFVRDASFSLLGGNEVSSFFTSVAYNDSKGIVDGNALDRLSSRINFSQKVTNALTMGVNVSYSRSDIDRVSSDGTLLVPLGAIAQAPISPAFLNGEPFANTVYPNYLLEDKHSYFNTVARRLNGKIFGEYQVSPVIKINVDFGYDLYDQSEDQFRGSSAPLQPFNGSYFSSENRTDIILLNAVTTFKKSINNNHKFEFLIGTEFIDGKLRSRSVTAVDFPSDDFQNISSASTIIDGEGFDSAYRFISYFSRLNYKLNDRYLFKASIRRDGSSRFGENNRFGTFPSFSFAWIISEESFAQEFSSWLDFLKLRASWGEVGNAEIGDFEYSNLFFGTAYGGIPGIEPGQPGNSFLTWESATQVDLGLDFSLFNKSVTGDIAYYYKNNDGLLFNEPLIPSSGPATISVIKNVGRMITKGIELSLNFNPVQTDKFTLAYSLNIAQINNTIEKLPGSNDVIFNFGLNILREGETINSFYLPEYAGVDPDNGDALYYLNTLNSDGSLNRSTTNDPAQVERIIAGHAQPDWIGGLTQNITYKNFDLNASFIGEWGNHIYNLGGIFESSNGDWFDNQTRDQLDRWQNPGDITDIPQARLGGGNGAVRSTRYLQRGDFIRLRSLTLGYNFPEYLSRKIGFSMARIYLSGVNLLTITKFDGYDPESRTDVRFRKGGGLIAYSAPSAKTYTLGVSLRF